MRSKELLACAALITMILAGCSTGEGGSGGLPPVPSLPSQEGGPDQPPVVWIGGELTEVTAELIELRGDSGSVVTLQRLGRQATGVFRVSEGQWRRLAPGAPITNGQEACVETLMDGQTLLALRVFLGAACGPA